MLPKKIADRIFEIGENFIYIVVGILLIITVIFLIYDSFITLFRYPVAPDFVRWIVEILDKILLMLMIIEILYTVRVSFREHTLSAEPILLVALIAAIRRILVISVESAYLPEKFQPHMIEISILGVLIFIFVVSIVMLRKKIPEKSS